MKSKLFWRLFGVFLAVVLFTVLLFSFLMVAMVRSERQQALEAEVFMQARDVAQLMKQRDEASFWRADPTLNTTINWKIKEIQKNYSADIWLVNSNGYVLSMGTQFFESAREQLGDPEVVAFVFKVLEGQEVRAQGLFPELGNDMVTIGVPWTYMDGRVLGAVLLHISTSDLVVDYSDMVSKVSLAAFAALIVGTVLVYAITRRQVKPLKEINNAVSDFAKGKLERRVQVPGDDEIAQLAASINHMAEDLSNLEESRKSFVASVSHELRSPLTCIQGYLQGMIDGTIPQEEYAKYMSVVVEETRRLTKLVNELLDLSRFESGKFPLSITRFDINELVRCALIKYEQSIDAKNISVDVEFREQPCYVMADADRISQVVANLVDNAVKFLDAGGQLTVWTHTVDALCYVTVKDNGAGISSEDLPFIFDRFYKADKAHTSGKGTGLGLSIVKKILEQHGQSISVTSTLGKGTSFVFTLERAADQSPPSKQG